jgi:antitoxin component of MazEF toxin-antitoxin module
MASDTLNLIKIGNSRGFCIPSNMLKELGTAETYLVRLNRETGTLEIKPSEGLMDRWIKDFKEKGNDGIVENVPVVMLTDTLIEDLQFQPDFEGEENRCRKTKTSKSRKGGKSLK